jgi:hypothetical protein
MEPHSAARHESLPRGWVYLAQTMLLRETVDWGDTESAALAAIPQFTAAPEAHADLPFYFTWMFHNHSYYRYWAKSISKVRNGVEYNIVRFFKGVRQEELAKSYFNPSERLPSSAHVPDFCDVSCSKTTCPVRRQQLALFSSTLISTSFKDDFGSLLLEMFKSIFYCWRGKSGNRYPCTIYGLHQTGLLASQPRLAIVGAKRSQDAVLCRAIIPVKSCGASQIAQQCNLLLQSDCNEWHVPYDVERMDAAQLLSDFPDEDAFKSATGILDRR